MNTIPTLQRDFGTDLMGQVGGALTSGISGAVGGIMGLPLAGISNNIQAGQQQKLADIQEQENEKLSAFNYNEQMQMWKNTNYPAQVQELNEAGLNPALEYGKGGGGGTTTGTPTGGIGMGIAAPNQAMAGQQNNIAQQEAEADIKLKNAQAENIAAQTPQEADIMKSQIDSINQGVNNARAQEILTDAQTQMTRLSNSIQGETIDDTIAQIRATASKIQQETQQAIRNNWMDQQTVNDKIKTINGIMIGQFIQNSLQQAQTTQTNTNTQLSIENIKSIATKIQQDWQQLDINKQNANTQEGHLKLQQLIKDVPDSQGYIYQGLQKLIPNIIY